MSKVGRVVLPGRNLIEKIVPAGMDCATMANWGSTFRVGGKVSGCTPCGMCSSCLVPPASHIMVRGALVWLGVGWCAPGCTLLACCGLGGGWVAAVWPLWLGGCPGLLDPLLLVAVWLVPGPAVPGYSAPLPASSVVALVFGRRVVARAVAGRPLFGGARVSSLLGWCIPLWSLGILTRCSFLRLLCSVLVAVF